MQRFRIIKRQERLGWRSCFILLTAIALALLLSAVMLVMRGTPPVEGILTLFKGAFGSRWAIEDSLIKAIPIFLCSLGVATAFRLQIWNIGAEGQFALGAIGATWAALTFPELSQTSTPFHDDWRRLYSRRCMGYDSGNTQTAARY
jgi:simple sugar transport system permease protein